MSEASLRSTAVPVLTKRPQPRQLPPGRCLHWIAQGWRSFARQPFEWALMALATFFVLAIVSTLIVPVPIVGPILAPVALTLLVGGLLHAAEREAQGMRIAFKDLFEGFRRHGPNLALVGVFYSIPLVLMSLVTLLALGGGLLVGLLGTALGGPVSGMLNGLVALLGTLATGWLFSFIALLLMILTLISAPALVMFCDTPPLDAMRLSLRASMRNFGATLCFGVLLYVLFLLAVIPAGLGLLVVIPVAAAALREAYVDIFASHPLSLTQSSAES